MTHMSQDKQVADEIAHWADGTVGTAPGADYPVRDWLRMAPVGALAISGTGTVLRRTEEGWEALFSQASVLAAHEATKDLPPEFHARTTWGPEFDGLDLDAYFGGLYGLKIPLDVRNNLGWGAT